MSDNCGSSCVEIGSLQNNYIIIHTFILVVSLLNTIELTVYKQILSMRKYYSTLE